MGGGDGGGGNFCCGQILHYYISTVTDANLVTVHNKQTKLANSTTLALITVGTPNAYSVTTYCECIAELATYDKFIYYVKPVIIYLLPQLWPCLKECKLILFDCIVFGVSNVRRM